MISFFKRSFFSLIKSAELVIFPSSCHLCSVLLEREGEKVVCDSCLSLLSYHRRSFCVCCGRFFGREGNPHLCGDCITKNPPFAIHRSCGSYQGNLKDVILLYKYRKYRVLSKALAGFADRILGNDEALWWDIDLIIPVPIDSRRKRERGFNQAELIARELAKKKHVPCLTQTLGKAKFIPPQTSLAALERSGNVKGAFKVLKPEKIKGKTVLLVDDVFTTGATVKACSQELIKAGVKEVRVLTIAQA